MSSKPSKSSSILLIVTLAVFLTGAVAFAVYSWVGMADVELSGHGIFAMILGILVTLGLGVGLMALVFFSNKRGYDDAAH